MKLKIIVMKIYFAILFSFIMSQSIVSQSVTITGPSEVCAQETITYGFDDFVNCHGSGDTRWQIEIEVEGGRIMSYTTRGGITNQVNSSSLELTVLTSTLDACSNNPPTTVSGVSNCLDAAFIFANNWIETFDVRWDDYQETCEPKITLIKRDQWQFIWFWLTSSCEAEDVLEVDVAVPASLGTPQFWIPGQVCGPNCDNEVTICINSCVNDPDIYSVKVNNGEYFRASNCFTVPWDPNNSNSEMTVCVQELNHCGLSMEKCQNISLEQPYISGPISPACESTYWFIPSTCELEYDANSVTWTIYTDSFGANLEPINGPGVNVEFFRDGIYMLEMCYEECEEIKCLTREIYVERDCINNEFKDTDDSFFEKSIVDSDLSIVGNLIFKGGDVSFYSKNKEKNNFTVVDLNGIVQTVNIFQNGEGFSFSTKNLESGIYFLSDGTLTDKFIVK